MTERLRIDMTFHLIQQVRLLHALTESDFDICIPAAEQPKFEFLKKKFGLELYDGADQFIDITGHVSISHAEPVTSIRGISRPLIFPHAITEYCRSLWSKKREFRYSFQGLITRKRQSLIESWIRENLKGERLRLSDHTSLVSRLQRRILSRMGIVRIEKKRIGELVLWSSDRGRRFPVKAWDENFFRNLANSQFVLCPSGDHIWSYRFFESILCGAIPIVEADCAAYKGFRFFHFDDRAEDLKWSIEDADYNYGLCTEKVTVPLSTLNGELKKITDAYFKPHSSWRAGSF